LQVGYLKKKTLLGSEGEKREEWWWDRGAYNFVMYSIISLINLKFKF
jgi:hypothetical protein